MNNKLPGSLWRGSVFVLLLTGKNLVKHCGANWLNTMGAMHLVQPMFQITLFFVFLNRHLFFSFLFLYNCVVNVALKLGSKDIAVNISLHVK